jgi:hypothetical protein
MPQGQVPGHTARRIGWPGYALIVAFWTFFGVLMLTGRRRLRPAGRER